MKKTYFLLAVVSFGIFALAGCGTSTAPTNGTAAKNTTAAPSAAAAPKADAPAATILKPGDVSADKAVKVNDLVDSAAADKAAWKGKEVAVTGYVSATSGSGDHLLLTLTSDQTSNSKIISCAAKGVKADEVFTKTIEVKGKISNVNTDGEVKTINLEPCEVKK